MSTILYYSNFCGNCKNVLSYLSKMDVRNHAHFICIDKRIVRNNKTYIVLESGDEIVLPPTIDKVPALLLLNQGYNILYGDEITNYFKPIQKEQVQIATQNNIDPISFSFNSGFNNVVSDQFSFLDMDPDDLSASGKGGIRQMHNYVNTDFNDKIHTPEDEVNYKSSKIPQDVTIESLRQQRDSDLNSIIGNRKPQF